MKLLLRQYIRALLYEKSEILAEPDLPEDADKEQDEGSSVAGVITPLGTGPRYPDEDTGHRRSPAAAAGSAFGGAKPYKSPRKKNNK